MRCSQSGCVSRKEWAVGGFSFGSVYVDKCLSHDHMNKFNMYHHVNNVFASLWSWLNQVTVCQRAHQTSSWPWRNQVTAECPYKIFFWVMSFCLKSCRLVVHKLSTNKPSLVPKIVTGTTGFVTNMTLGVRFAEPVDLCQLPWVSLCVVCVMVCGYVNTNLSLAQKWWGCLVHEWELW